MAVAPRRPCSQPKCSQLQPCTLHPVIAWRPRFGPPVCRVRGRKLQQLRLQLFRRQPWCVLCLEQKVYTTPTIRDHIVPLAEGGRDDTTNEQALCGDCSDRKTQRESARGVRRSR